jgi:hypothetical protein
MATDKPDNTKPLITVHDALLDLTVTREMTEKEIQILLQGYAIMEATSE